MRVLKAALALLSLYCIPAVLGSLPGPSYPAPREISCESSSVTASWKNVRATLDQTLKGGGMGKLASSLLKNTTFSMGMFSLYDQGAHSMQYHHTALATLNGTVGAKKVDGSTIYHVASISKLITTYAGMIELHENDWNIPLSDIFSGFKDLVEKTAENYDAVQDIQWDKITLGDIAAQIGGIPRLGIPISSDFVIAALSNPSVLDTWGLPPPNLAKDEAQYPCAKYLASGSFAKCSIEEYAQGIASNPPRYPPATSPLYSDSGFFLLGGALSNLTGMSLDELYRKAIFEPLGLKSTLSNPPTEPAVIARTVVPKNLATDFFNVPITTPSGGLYSTINDLSKIGVSILNSTLLPTDKTNRWMKPVSFTADLRYAVGRPWEIYRYVHQDTGVVTDIYTKLGDSGDYCGLLVLVPDFEIGFTILGASSTGVHTQAVQLVADLLTDSMMPALMTQARHEAATNLAGTYNPKDKGLNTTLSLSVPSSSKSAPGLVITEWISNGTDIKNILATTLIDLVPHVPLPPTNPDMVRLIPTIQDVAASGQIAFQMDTVNPTGPVKGHLFSKMYDVGDWASTIDQLTYQDIPINEFVFHLDKKTGKAFSVTPSAYHVELERRK
ncbi:alkaline D-peptidase [Penicillium riverlandense]|uniref:alkaline D-peptidase n=1 Tax=Penicillium riverlandense TaxID=1903569 RepID=UPI002546D528|nr:alkaline D-peptidase [Penicillium riverlandense]KAJ5825895.1 alkaline D-peptidase [Penicillium riverlandense]